MALLEFKNVTKFFHRTRAGFVSKGAGGKEETILALKDVSMTVSPGQSLGVVGQSGAGKTTLVALAAGLEKPTSGTVTVKGEAVDPGDNRGARRRARVLQYIWQDAPGSLNPRLRVERIVAEPLIIHRVNGKKETCVRVAELLEEVGLNGKLARRYPNELSGGEAQRVVIARALALDPELLICDEPASALDATIKANLAMLLKRLRQERGLALLIIAHDLHLIRSMCPELMVMNQGSVVERGFTTDVLGSPKHEHTKRLIEAEPLLRI